MDDRTTLLNGTLDVLVLKALATEELHGLGVARRIELLTGGTFQVAPGSLFPALHRLAREGWVKSAWGRSETNRRAKFYRLTAAGKQQLARETGAWKKIAVAMARALETT